MEFNNKITDRFRISILMLGLLFQLIFIYDFPKRQKQWQRLPYYCIIEQPSDAEHSLCVLILSARACKDGSIKDCRAYDQINKALGCFSVEILTKEWSEYYRGDCP